jgi:hypothetical protein
LQSPLAPFAKSIPGIDSSVFIYTAQQILDGQMIYKDIVDHKGPFLYLINVIALFCFNGKWMGIWIFEIFSMFIACIMMYKTARMFAGKFVSVLAVITSILMIVPVLIGGNLTEEWALPYISIAMYIFLSYLKENKSLTTWRLFILSFTFVLTLMLRANLIAVWGGFGIALLIKWIVEKQYKEFIRCLSLMLFFVIISIVPFFLYFYLKGTLSDALYLVFQFNLFEYALISENSLTGMFKMSLLTFCSGISYFNFIPNLVIVYMFFTKKDQYAGVISAFILTIISCRLGQQHEHYFMIFIPLFVIPLAYLYNILKQCFRKKVFLWLCITFIFYNSANIYSQYANIRANHLKDEVYGLLTYSQMDTLTDIIWKNTKATDKILVKTNQAAIYLYSHRTSATRFPYAITNSSSLALKYYVKDIEETLPKMIIEAYHWDEYDIQPILDAKYQLIQTDLKDINVWLLKE